MTATTTPLATGYAVRRPTLDDVGAVYELEHVCDLAMYGEADTVEEDVRSSFASTSLERDAWLVTDASGTVVAATLLWFSESGRFFGQLNVHPAHRRRGIGTHLRELLEGRARERVADVSTRDMRVALNASAYHESAETRRFLERAGYGEVRHFWRMQIDMDREPPVPTWPEGITVRIFERGRDELAVYDAEEAAFSDHWGHVRHTYEEWERWSLKREDFDPSLWFLAMDGDQIAGIALDWLDQEPARGWVGTLGVLRPYRRRGLGEALLAESFGTFWRRGVRRVVLGVDSESLTGATRLYTRVGMRAVRQWDSFQKELRAGRDLAVSTLS